MSCDPRSPSRDFARSGAFLASGQGAFGIDWTISRRSVAAAHSVAGCFISIFRAAAARSEISHRPPPSRAAVKSVTAATNVDCTGRRRTRRTSRASRPSGRAAIASPPRKW